MAVKIPDCGFKFRVKNKKHSEQLQRVFFHYGFRWRVNNPYTCQFIDKPFLFIHKTTNYGSYITYCEDIYFFEEHIANEMVLNQFIDFMKNIKGGYTIFGKKIDKKR